MDLAPRIVAAAARLLPNERHEWGTAMIAELAHVEGAHSRLRFALGCMRASLVASWPAPAPSKKITATMLAGVAACVAIMAYALTRYPIAAAELSGSGTTKFALLMLGYVWIALLPPRTLTASRRAMRIGSLSGIALAAFVAPTTWAIESLAPRIVAEPMGPVLVLLATTGTFVTCSVRLAASERSFRAGLNAALWVGTVSAPLAFSVDMLGTISGFNFQGHLFEMKPGAAPELSQFLSKHMGEHLATSMRSLVSLPIFAAALGALGAAVGKRRLVARGALR